MNSLVGWNSVLYAACHQPAVSLSCLGDFPQVTYTSPCSANQTKACELNACITKVIKCISVVYYTMFIETCDVDIYLLIRILWAECNGSGVIEQYYSKHDI